MKNKKLILPILLASFCLVGCATFTSGGNSSESNNNSSTSESVQTSEECSSETNEAKLSNAAKNGLTFVANTIRDFYETYKKCNYAELMQQSFFKNQDDTSETVFGKVTVDNYNGVDTFIFSYNENDSTKQKVSIVTSYGNRYLSKDLDEVYNNAFSKTVEEDFFEYSKANKYLQDTLKRLFKNGLDENKQETDENGKPIHKDEGKLANDFKYTIDKNGGVKILGYVGKDRNNIVIPSYIDGKPVRVVGYGSFLTGSDEKVNEYYLPLDKVTLPNTIEVVEESAFYPSMFVDWHLYRLEPIDYIYVPKSTIIFEQCVDSTTKVIFEEYDTYPGSTATYSNVSKSDLLEEDGVLYLKQELINGYSEATVVDVLSHYKDVTIKDEVIINNEKLKVTSLGNRSLYLCKDLETLNLSNNLTSFNSNAIVSNATSNNSFGCLNLKLNEYKGGLYFGTTKNPYFVLFDTKENLNFVNDNTKFIYSGIYIRSKTVLKLEEKIYYLPSETNHHFCAISFDPDSYSTTKVDYFIHEDTKLVNVNTYDDHGFSEYDHKIIYIGKNVEYIYLNYDHLENSAIQFSVDSLNTKYESADFTLIEHLSYGNKALFVANDAWKNSNKLQITKKVNIVGYKSINANDKLEILTFGDNILRICKNPVNHYDPKIKEAYYSDSIEDLASLLSFRGTVYTGYPLNSPLLKITDTYIASSDELVLLQILKDTNELIYHIPEQFDYITYRALDTKYNHAFIVKDTIKQSVGSNKGKVFTDTDDPKYENRYLTSGKIEVIDNIVYRRGSNGIHVSYSNKLEGEVKISDYAFNNEPVKIIDTWVFCGADKVSKFTLGANLVSIQQYAFQGSSISSLIVPSKVVTIADKAFSDCPNLDWIVIPKSATNLNGRVFAYTRCTIYLEFDAVPKTYSYNWNEYDYNTNNKYVLQSNWHFNENNIPVKNGY